MRIFMTSVIKSGNKIVKMRILGLGEYKNDIKDVDCKQIADFIKAGKVKIENLTVDSNGELKGVNGSIDRYGVLGKSQALIILDEITDENGNVIKYKCADAAASIATIEKAQAINIAELIGIANGKVVTKDDKKFISAIDGSYHTIVEKPSTFMQQPVKSEEVPKKEEPKKEEVHENKVMCEHSTMNADNQTNTTEAPAQSGDATNYYEEARKLIIELNEKKKKEFKADYAYKIAYTVGRNKNCSLAQYNAIQACYNKIFGIASTSSVDKLTQEALDMIKELKERDKQFSSSFAAKVAKSIVDYNKCTDKQYNVIKKYYDKFIESENKPEQTAAETPVTETTAPVEEEKPVVNDTETAENDEPAVSEVSEPVTSEEKQEERVNEQSNNITEAEAIELANRSIEAKKTAEISKRPKFMSNAQFTSDDILKYQMMNNNKIYVAGFVDEIKNDPDKHPEFLNIPDKTTINGVTYNVSGIKIGAFFGTFIKRLKITSSIEDIGQEAFARCTKLEEVDLSEGRHSFIANNLFKECRKLSAIAVGNRVERIHEFAFEGCWKLSEIELPDCTDTIARHAFDGCEELTVVKHNAKDINEAAFLNCVKLDSFDFSSVNKIGSQAFRGTGFVDLVIPGNVTSIGRNAFADCKELKNVEIQDGVQTLDIGVFYKKLKERVSYSTEISNTPIDIIKTPKSLISIGADAFLNAKLVSGYIGSIAESHCLSYGIPFAAIDSTNEHNSVRLRIVSNMMNIDPIDELRKAFISDTTGMSNNPNVVLKTHKMVDIALNENWLKTFGITPCTVEKEPHAKFKGLVNYLQDVEDMYTLPLNNTILRMQKAYYVDSEKLLDDGCNCVAKITYTIKDTLEAGSFIIVIMNNHLRFVCKCSAKTNITLDKELYNDDFVGFEAYLHAGDTIGKQATFVGKNAKCTYIDDNGFEKVMNVGQVTEQNINRNGIFLTTSKKDQLVYVPSGFVCLSLHDGRVYDAKNRLSSDSKDCINILSIMSYDDMIKEINSGKNLKSTTYDETKLFEKIQKMSEYEVSQKINSIDTIEEEKETYLYGISKKFFNRIPNVEGAVITPDSLTMELFNELSMSYWMIHKDAQWLASVGTKSLNKTNEYKIDNYKLIEYKSNQIVKFSNPYMSGQKGAYIFKLVSGLSTIGVYASKYSLAEITRMLYNLTDMHNQEDKAIELMTSASKFDKTAYGLWYPFYSVLYSKDGWRLSNYSEEYMYVNISMYKPTGVMYLTLTTFVNAPQYKNGKVERVGRNFLTLPILPIGNMDRALIVADTTNTNAKSNAFKAELINLILAIKAIDSGRTPKDVEREVYDKYVAARQLIINGDKDMSKYANLVDDRALFMLGTKHTGQLLRDKGQQDYLGYDTTEPEIDIELDNETEEYDLNDDTEEVEIDTSDIEVEEDTDEDVEYELDESEEDDGEFTLEQFTEIAKSQGITDEATIRAMYINFMNQQQ